MTEPNLRILIAEDHTVVREGLVSLLSTPRFRMDVVGEATNGSEAVALAASLTPDVVVLDLLMPEMDGFEAIRRILAHNPAMRILVLTSCFEPEHAGEVMRLGARGFVPKDASVDDLIQGIRSVARGQAVVPAELTASLLGNVAGPAKQKSPHPADTLTERERVVLAFLAKGMSNKEIADKLSISANTVRSYVHLILGKLGVSNRTQAALYAKDNNFQSGV